MATLSRVNVESELSYAYLHAIAGKAGMSCKSGDRHDDGYGVDAEVQFRGNTGHAYIKHVQLNIQLKATVAPMGNYPNHVSYFIQGVERYNKLRTKDSTFDKILAVLFLPADSTQWINCSVNDLIIKNCAYWVCLHGAPASTNTSGETIYLPKANLLTPASLEQLAKDSANNSIPNYSMP